MFGVNASNRTTLPLKLSANLIASFLVKFKELPRTFNLSSANSDNVDLIWVYCVLFNFANASVVILAASSAVTLKILNSPVNFLTSSS